MVRFQIQTVEKHKSTFNNEKNMNDESPMQQSESLINVEIESNQDNCVESSDTESVHESIRSENESLFNGRRSISRALASIRDYTGGSIPQNTLKPVKKIKKLGTIAGVYFPCLQNIFGVILFIRLTWIVGVAGIFESFGVVILCCFTTLTTAISMSAIATNGMVAGGGSYFMISRALGPAIGSAVGILFYLGTSFATSMYIVGSVEILLKYISPSIAILWDPEKNITIDNDYRIYGSAILIILTVIVFMGVRFVSLFAPVALFCVVVSIISVYIGIITANFIEKPDICVLQNGALIKPEIYNLNISLCTDEYIRNYYCNQTLENCNVYNQHQPVYRLNSIPGFKLNTIKNNLYATYRKIDHVYTYDRYLNYTMTNNELRADVTSSFIVFIALFFPSCTGIMAGSNRSGDLANPQNSIPRGTIAAVLTTSFVYLSSVILFGAVIEGPLMKDKFGESVQGGLLVAKLCWPNEWVVLIGSFLSTIGAGLQCLTGAPRLLLAISDDNVIPFLKYFGKRTKSGGPITSLIFTFLIALCGIIFAKLEYIAPIVTMFFLMCYSFVNIACTLQTMLKSPNWRPRFFYYHWTLSLLGTLMCMCILIISVDWYYLIPGLLFAAFIYKYVEYYQMKSSAEKEWGDGLKGLTISAAHFSLRQLEDAPIHVKNWRPQVLLLVKADSDPDTEENTKIFAFARQLKAGKGLMMVATVLRENLQDSGKLRETKKQEIKKIVKREKLKAFVDVVISKSVAFAIRIIIQSIGIGRLRPNTVVLNWPNNWENNMEKCNLFLNIISGAYQNQCAVLIPRFVEKFPKSTEKLNGTVDVWWIVDDGGLLLLIPFLLKKHKVWKGCRLRIFTVAKIGDNSIKMKKDIQTFLYELRITAQVEIVEMDAISISAYTVEQTLKMEKRSELLQNFKKRKHSIDVQELVDRSRKGKLKTKKDSIISLENKLVNVSIDNVTRENPDKETFQNSTSKDTSRVTFQDKKFSINKTDSSHFIPPNTKKHSILKTSKSRFKVKPLKNKNKNRHTESIEMSSIKCNLLTQHGSGNNLNQYTFSNRQDLKKVENVNMSNLKKMHSASGLNEKIVKKSGDAQLVIINLPTVPKTPHSNKNYMNFVEVLTVNVKRLVLVHGSGMEVVTIFT